MHVLQFAAPLLRRQVETLTLHHAFNAASYTLYNVQHRFKTLGKAPFQVAKNNLAITRIDRAYNASASGAWDELVLQLIYWDSNSGSNAMKAMPHFGYYPGKGVAALRSGWTHADSYLAAKGGDSTVTHQDLDHGHFVWETKGYRWAIDLGESS